ncbi:MAG: amidohydrolase family protein, partial [Nitrososphaerota archaeon]|nr:amidohydrolase family protein [Nitrososphaerota archaeon]
MAIIDCHTHFAPDTYLHKLKEAPSGAVRQFEVKKHPAVERTPHLHDLEKRLSDLDKYKIDYEVATPQPSLDPNLLPIKDVELLDYCRVFNDGMADMMRKSKGRIFSIGAIPINIDSKVAASEMRRAVRDLGLKGFSVLSNVSEQSIDKFEFIWSEANNLDVPIYIHPANPPSHQFRKYEDEYDLIHVLGWPYETSLILTRLIMSGIVEKYPKARVVSHHLGGMVPYLAGRLAESYDGKTISKQEQAPTRLLKPSVLDYFRNFFYDTAVGGSAAAIKCCI